MPIRAGCAYRFVEGAKGCIFFGREGRITLTIDS